ncbi:transcriptional regulator with XRE-family HTH domain [Sinorhizobium fredii]
MDNNEFRAIRQRLGLTQAQLATVLLYPRATQVSEIERPTNPKPVPRHVALLMRAYDEGYRPKDWPCENKG